MSVPAVVSLRQPKQAKLPKHRRLPKPPRLRRRRPLRPRPLLKQPLRLQKPPRRLPRKLPRRRLRRRSDVSAPLVWRAQLSSRQRVIRRGQRAFCTPRALVRNNVRTKASTASGAASSWENSTPGGLMVTRTVPEALVGVFVSAFDHLMTHLYVAAFESESVRSSDTRTPSIGFTSPSPVMRAILETR